MATRDELLPYDKTRLSKVCRSKKTSVITKTKKRIFFFSTLLLYTESDLQVMNVETESILLRRTEFFLQYDIEVWLKKEVSLGFSLLFYLFARISMNCFNGVKLLLRLQALSVNTDEKIVTFDDGSVQSYDQLLIATGSRSRLGEFRFFHPECCSFI